jgi:hypothetical protein
LDLLHSTPCGPRAIAETLDPPAFHRLGQLANQTRDHAYYVPQQRVDGRVMNVRLHHRGIDPQLRAVLQAKVNRTSLLTVGIHFPIMARQSSGCHTVRAQIAHLGRDPL